MIDQSDIRVVEHLKDQIEEELNRAGLLFRVFARAKSPQSLQRKFQRNSDKYSSSGKKIQDVFGIRVILYFPDDGVIAQEILKSIYEYDESSSTIDMPDKDSFSASRCNLLFRLPDDQRAESRALSTDDRLDSTFEVQFRTILSEGWHEVEHDLRYKCQDDWKEHDDLSRSLNGILASLETSDWGMMKVFEELAYRHYKSNEWSQMVRTKFRLRLIDGELTPELLKQLNSNPLLGKEIFRLSRSRLIRKLIESKFALPMTSNNLIYLANYFFIKNSEISHITPGFVLSEFRLS